MAGPQEAGAIRTVRTADHDHDARVPAAGMLKLACPIENPRSADEVDLGSSWVQKLIGISRASPQKPQPSTGAAKQGRMAPHGSDHPDSGEEA
jgi:hypothetical protein